MGSNEEPDYSDGHRSKDHPIVPIQFEEESRLNGMAYQSEHRKDDDVHLRMTKKSEEVLEQQRVTTTCFIVKAGP